MLQSLVYQWGIVDSVLTYIMSTIGVRMENENSSIHCIFLIISYIIYILS